MEAGPSKLRLPLVVVDLHREQALRYIHQLVDNLTSDPNNQRYTTLVWNSTGLDDTVICGRRLTRLRCVVSTTRFLNARGLAEQMIRDWAPSCVVVVDTEARVGPGQVERLLEKFEEYDSAMILCSQGLRLFPHKPEVEPKDFWDKDRYIQYYNNNHTDREVHLFVLNGGCCLFPTAVLTEALTLANDLSFTESCHIIDFQMSFIAQKRLNVHIWKVQLGLNDGNHTTFAFKFSSDTLTELHDFYRTLRKYDWPSRTFSPILSGNPLVPRNKDIIWAEGFHGLNMSAEPVHLDFDAAYGYGARVVRFGAVNDAKDLAFLINDIPDGSSETDRIHLELALPRLRKSIRNAGDSGLKVILSLCDLPGRRFRDSADDRMWRSCDCRQRIADLWGAIAEGLSDLSDVIIGYDIINEPFTPEDNDLSFDCPMSGSFVNELKDLYTRALESIRKVDKTTMVIVESSFWASPRTMPFISPLNDPFVIYSFHFYAPNLYTYRHDNDGRYGYPGKIPKWKADPWVDDWPLWNEDKIREVIQPVIQWQKDQAIPTSRVFVGEFGVSREVPGAQRYMSDVMKIWRENHWSWCLFSFRDNEWDAMDYELGEDKTNQLDRKPTDLMTMISNNLS